MERRIYFSICTFLCPCCIFHLLCLSPPALFSSSPCLLNFIALCIPFPFSFVFFEAWKFSPREPPPVSTSCSFVLVSLSPLMHRWHRLSSISTYWLQCLEEKKESWVLRNLPACLLSVTGNRKGVFEKGRVVPQGHVRAHLRRLSFLGDAEKPTSVHQRRVQGWLHFYLRCPLAVNTCPDRPQRFYGTSAAFLPSVSD